MRELSLRLAKNVVGSATFAEAVRRNQNAPQWSQARESSERIAGKIVESGCWEDDRLALLLSGGLALYFAARSEVEWAFVSESEFAGFSSSWRSDSEPIRANLQGVSGELLVSDIDRKGIMSRLIGQRVQRMMSDDFGVYLRLQGPRFQLALHALVVNGGDSQFLFWFEDKD